MELIHRLQEWYKAQCDGDWEHQNGVRIETLDNPGWKVTINLDKTALAQKEFKLIAHNVPQEFIDQAMGKAKSPFVCASPLADDWMLCFVQNKTFDGAGDSNSLVQILEIFLNWSQ